MVRKIQVCALGLIGALGYTTSAFAQVAEAPSVAKPAEATAGTTEPAVVSAPVAPPPAAAEPAPAAAPAPAPAPAAEPPAPPPTAYDSLKIESKNATLKLGLLVQPQFESISGPGTDDAASNNLFVRRTRLLVGGTLFGKFEYFFDTDAPNLFKGADGTGQKANTGIAVQDAFGTWKAYEDMIKLDAGYMLTPGAHNALQGAGTLLGLDYFSNSFLHSNSFNSAGPAVAGRDAGAQLRGLLLDGHIEYRAGIFQGNRRPASATEVAARNGFRFAGRVQINILDPETGFFYGGTYLGKKKILSVGAALDLQNDYKHWAVDAFADMPLGPGGLTAQANFSKWNGGDFVPLANQTAFMAEAGYRFDGIQLAPIVKFETRNVADSEEGDTRFGGGVAWFPYAHNINLKAFFTHISSKNAMAATSEQNQFQLQWQLYFY